MSKDSTRFNVACREKGIARARCGLAVRDLLLDLRREPLKAVPSRCRCGGLTTGRASGMGTAVKEGLARFVAAERWYVITPAGETWLQKLEIHGLMPETLKGNTDAAQRVPTTEVMAQ